MSESGRGLLANASSLFFGRLGIALMGWAGTVLIVRTLDQDQFGQFAFVFSLLGMMTIFTDMGIGRLAITGVLDKNQDQARFAGTYIILRTMLGGVGYLMSILFVVVANYPGSVVRATAIGGLSLLISTPSAAYNVAFQAHMRLQTVAISGVIGQAAQLAVTVAIAVRGGTLLLFVIPPVIAEVVMLGFKLPRARRLIPFHYVVDLQIWKGLAREAIPLSLGGALSTISFRIDAVMLSKLDTFEAVGAYSVAYKFADLARFASTALTVPILTVLAKAWPDDLDRYRQTIRQGAIYLSFVGGLLLMEMLLFAEPVIRLLYGNDYAFAGDAARILVGSTTVVFFTGLAFNSLVAADKHRWYPLVTFIGLSSNVLINLVLIPRYSFEGAAVATLVTEVVVMSMLWWILMRIPGLGPIGLGFLPRVVVAGAGAYAVGAVADQVTPWPIAATFAGTAYLGIAHVLRTTGPRGLKSLTEDRLT
ncbi:MAG: flippase [Acidimicrobiales bacterium]|nr:flippase [Acidimicrobiales bacterium]